MSILFLLLGLLLAICAAVTVTSFAILWYDTANREPGLVADRFRGDRLLFALRLLATETLCLLLSVLTRPLGWFPGKSDDLRAASGPAVLLLHGLFHNRGCWWWVARQLRRRGMAVYTVNLQLWHTPLAAVEIVAEKIEEIVGEGAKTVCLVGHSMGGLIARQYLRERGASRVEKCVLLGAPHQGSRLAPFAASPTGLMLMPGSEYLHRLNDQPFAAGVRCLAIYSRHDNMVLPWESGRLEGMPHRELSGIGHTALLYHPQAVQALLAEIYEDAHGHYGNN
ncbi:MAG: alpha/beta fold hydrolase [Desulfuromonadales bacterium]